MEKKKKLYYRYNVPSNKEKKLNALQKKRLASVWIPKMIVCFLFLVIGICSISVYKMMFFPRIQLEGSSVITIPYESKYEELGYLSSYQGKDLTNQVKVHGKVNFKKLGEYPITYTVTYHGRTVSKTRVVKVVDNKKPKRIEQRIKTIATIYKGQRFINNIYNVESATLETRIILLSNL